MTAITNFQSSLLREKFEIYDPNFDRQDVKPVVALSNRLVVTLKKDKETPAEEYVIRAQNMHLCARLAGRIVHSFNIGGSLKNRAKPIDWGAVWAPLVNDYERIHNEQRWVAIYHQGHVVFEEGERHPLLDLIEKCDTQNDNDYDYAIPLAENALKKAGKAVKIDHDANVALVVTFEDNEGRCGIILRGPDKTTTFNFTAFGTDEKTLNLPQCLYAAAAFLEGIQLAFLVGMNLFKINVGIIKRNSQLHKKTKEGQRRLGQLGAEIANLEGGFNVRFRPEKPEFNLIVREAEEQASRLIDVQEALAAIQKNEEEKDAELRKKNPPKSTNGGSSIFDIDD